MKDFRRKDEEKQCGRGEAVSEKPRKYANLSGKRVVFEMVRKRVLSHIRWFFTP
jgi:hypothetical protein